jgi:hypothetical protein
VTEFEDYVVAVDNATGTAIKSWPGERYRAYDQTKVTQYRIAMATSALDAEARALHLHDEYGVTR